MTEIKSGKSSQGPESIEVCRCRCEYQGGGPWFPLEFDGENAGLESTGTCGCGCGGSNDMSVHQWALI